METPRRDPVQGHVEVFVLGAGLSGVIMLKKLKDAGVTNVIAVDKASGVGGTWHWNRYPGAACDVDSYAYLPFLHEMSFCPSKKYVTAPEIKAYLEQVCKRHELLDRILLNTKLMKAAYDPRERLWSLHTDRDDAFTARFLIMGCGPLSTPRLPDIDGMNSFQGEAFHTSQWPENCDLSGKTVGVVGTGASAAQVVPELAKVAGRLYVFQRTPAWCVPREDGPTPTSLRRQLLDSAQFAKKMRQQTVNWFDNELYPQLQDVDRNAARAAELREALMATVKDPVVAAKLCPTHPVGCKRTCVVDDYWPTFNRENVTLVAEGGVSKVCDRGVITANAGVYNVDVLVYATGFDAFSGGFKGFDVRGVDGISLLEHWDGGPKTLYGIHVSGFPNMFLLVGPQSPTILQNTTEVIQTQAQYIVSVISKLRKTGAQAVVDVEPDTERKWIDHCTQHYPGSVWSRCDNWYNKKSQGAIGPVVVDGYIGKFSEYLEGLHGDGVAGLRFDV